MHRVRKKLRRMPSATCGHNQNIAQVHERRQTISTTRVSTPIANHTRSECVLLLQAVCVLLLLAVCVAMAWQFRSIYRAMVPNGDHRADCLQTDTTTCQRPYHAIPNETNAVGCKSMSPVLTRVRHKIVTYGLQKVKRVLVLLLPTRTSPVLL